ncbi:uncharacterized protein BXZ73DRAFT_100042 [Epithele typhae]|uniref:uncharacterized protein n=1 Tax=Epithele typhae TaxID=378194 RepID=UPI002007731C|nr:uncharacterized protein BXZ73DRAFT_100042 [Epithele typhae]KAH9937828.1 hypothetical protein BXZ73DRAFT_100042 [Epithele typhae]
MARLIPRLVGPCVPYSVLLPIGLASFVTGEESMSDDRESPLYQYEGDVFAHVYSIFPGFKDNIDLLHEHPELLDRIADYLTKVEGKARSDDLMRLKPLIIKLAGIPDGSDKLTANKRLRGFKNYDTGRLLTPYLMLDEFDRDPDQFCTDGASGDFLPLGPDFITAFYDLREAQPGEPLPGLMRSTLLVKAYRSVYCSPRNANVAAGHEQPGRGQLPLMRQYNLTRCDFTFYSIVWIASLVRFCLTDEPEWVMTHGDWDVQEFVAAMLVTARFKKRWLADLKKWWLPKIFGEDRSNSVAYRNTAFMQILDGPEESDHSDHDEPSNSRRSSSVHLSDEDEQLQA